MWAAFEELRTCKPAGFGTGPIPWTAIHAYAETLGLTREEEEELTVYLREIDAEMDRKPEDRT